MQRAALQAARRGEHLLRASLRRRDRLRVAEQGAAAERAFAAVSGRYEVGMANFIDVASAQTALAQARAAREQASVGQSLARARGSGSRRGG
ncbi:hypothetical protein tb265_23180 [Gemmatimonadetes bacterium T265]|nr:hypothetical protein tb265_23180 [Gemmatimonadetes bacterium T265]